MKRDGPNTDPRPVLDELEIVGNLHGDKKNLQSPSHPRRSRKPMETRDLFDADRFRLTPSAVSADTIGDSL